jgi:integrase
LLARQALYGQAFKPPSKKEIRLHRAAIGSRLFTAADLRNILAAAGQPLKSMVLLGINAALGNSDLAHLPIAAIDLERGWLDFARVKTGIERRTPLWPETVQAIAEWLPLRPTATDPADTDKMFVTKYGNIWAGRKHDSPITKEFSKVCATLGITAPKTFYSLRRTFQNIAEEGKDFLAARAIMGHADADVSTFYREKVSEHRLRAVTEFVQGWLFAAKGS